MTCLWIAPDFMTKINVFPKIKFFSIIILLLALSNKKCNQFIFYSYLGLQFSRAVNRGIMRFGIQDLKKSENLEIFMTIDSPECED